MYILRQGTIGLYFTFTISDALDPECGILQAPGVDQGRVSLSNRITDGDRQRE